MLSVLVDGLEHTRPEARLSPLLEINYSIYYNVKKSALDFNKSERSGLYGHYDSPTEEPKVSHLRPLSFSVHFCKMGLLPTYVTGLERIKLHLYVILAPN